MRISIGSLGVWWFCACSGSMGVTQSDPIATSSKTLGPAIAGQSETSSGGGSGAAGANSQGASTGNAGGASAGPTGGAGVGNGGRGRAGSGSANAGSGSANAAGCFHAHRLWFDDFESGNYSRWTSNTYCVGCADKQHWDGNNCQATALSAEQEHSPTHAQRSEISCAYTSNGNVHRGYGGLQFNGDQVVPAYTNAGVGLDAPHGVVSTWWIRLDSDTVFENGKWVSLFTTQAECNSSGDVLAFGLEDRSGHIEAAHYQAGGGTRQDVPGSPALPRHQWVRLTVYLNYHDGSMHVWQDGSVIEHVTFHRPLTTICQWHFGLYASGDNDSIVLFEDDFSLWKLDDAWTDLTQEPYFDHGVAVCN